MKVTLLGTGSVYAKSNCASILIDDILIDVGPGIIKYLIKNNYDLTRINNVIITHLHMDHILDLPTFIVNIAERGVKNKINFYCPQGTKEKMIELLHILYENWFDGYIEEYFNFITINKGFNFKVDNLEFATIDVRHTGIESYGFIVNHALGITGDPSLCENIHNIFRQSNKVITDCSFITGNEYHMGIDNIKILKEKYPDKQMFLTHFREETKKELLNHPIANVLVVEDGYSFEI